MTVTDQTQGKADDEYSKKNFREAIQLYTELIGKKTDLANNHLKRAKCFLELRINKNGLDDAKAALDLNPDSVDVLETLIKCCITINELELATENLQKLQQLDPDNKFAKKYAPKVNALKVKYAEEQEAMTKKDYARALALITECCNQVECNSFYRNEKIRIQIYLGNYADAEKEIGEMLFASKIDVEAIQLRAMLLWHKGKETLANRELELAEKLAKYLGGYQITSNIATKLHMQSHYLKYARNKLENGDPETALKFFQETVNQDMHNTIMAKQALYYQAACHEKLERYEDAIKACEESLKIDRGYAEALELQANCYKKSGQPNRAESNYRKLLEGDAASEKYKNYLKEVQKGGGADAAGGSGAGASGSGGAAGGGAQDADWEVLGVTENATLKQVQAAYRKLAQKYHSDQHVGKDDATKSENLRKMEQLNQAKENMEKRIKQKQQQKETPADPPIEIK